MHSAAVYDYNPRTVGPTIRISGSAPKYVPFGYEHGLAYRYRETEPMVIREVEQMVVCEQEPVLITNPVVELSPVRVPSPRVPSPVRLVTPSPPREIIPTQALMPPPLIEQRRHFSTGKRKALLVGINYIGREGLELQGCKNDAYCMAKFLDLQGWPTDGDHMRLLGEDATLDKLHAAIDWLMDDVSSGDALFFAFSGHGMQKRDFSGDEEDGLDEVLIASDGGHLDDDTLFEMLVQRVPVGAHLTAIIDCCHSGTVLDLPYTYHLTQTGIRQTTPNMVYCRRNNLAVGQTILFSACDDSQEAADMDFTSKYNSDQLAYPGGACIDALLTVLAQDGVDLNLLSLYRRMTDHLQLGRKLPQLPKISSVHELEVLHPLYLTPQPHPLCPLPCPSSSPRHTGNPILVLLQNEGKLDSINTTTDQPRSRGWFDSVSAVAGQFSEQIADQAAEATGNEAFGDFVGGAINNFASGGGLQSFVPNMDDIIEALKEALQEGVEHAVGQANREGGFLDDSRLKIPWPQDAVAVESSLRSIGADQQCEELVTVLNRSAEEAAGGTLEILVDCIFSMSLDDAKGILNGQDTAATDYMRDNSTTSLCDLLTPIITDAMEQFAVTRYWDDIINMYNAIPLVPDIDFDLVRYVVEKALLGLFTLVADKEVEIRADPGGAAHDMVQKVFGWKNDGCPE